MSGDVKTKFLFLIELIFQFHVLLRQEIKIHQENYDPNNLKDFVDEFLAKIEENKGKNSVYNGK